MTPLLILMLVVAAIGAIVWICGLVDATMDKQDKTDWRHRLDVLRRKHIHIGLTPQEQKELADLNLRAVREQVQQANGHR